jgi:hypothetical protein
MWGGSEIQPGCVLSAPHKSLADWKLLFQLAQQFYEEDIVWYDDERCEVKGVRVDGTAWSYQLQELTATQLYNGGAYIPQRDLRMSERGPRNPHYIPRN